MFRRVFALLMLLVALVLVGQPRASSVVDLELTISGDDFQIDGVTKFLPIASYFDAIHADLAKVDDDFGFLKADKFEGVRILPNWYRIPGPPDSTDYYLAQDTLFDKDGNLRTATLNKLLDILDLAKDHGLVVDLSFTVETVVDCPADNCKAEDDYTSALTYAEYKNALEDITTVLESGGSAYKHVMFDLQNEYDLNDPSDLSWDAGDMDDLAEAVHAIDSSRIVFASLGSSGWTATQAANEADLAELDVALMHEPRVEDWGNLSDLRASNMGAATDLPLYFQESPRYRTGEHSTSAWWSSAQAEKSLYEARRMGAAAWNFHTRGGFSLNDAHSGINDSIYDNLTLEDSTFMTARLKEILECVQDNDCPVADLAPVPAPSMLTLVRTLLRLGGKPVEFVRSAILQ